MGNNSWRPTVTMNDWMRDIEKRLLHEERRPISPDPYDVVGPGISAYSQEVDDWNADGPSVNGFFYSVGDQVVNSPDDTIDWIGTVQADPIGDGIQRVWGYVINDDPLNQLSPDPDPPLWTRSFVTNDDGTRTYSPWTQSSGGGTPTYTPFIQTFNFASPATVWSLPHNQDRFSLSVYAMDTNGDQLVAELLYPDPNTITLTHYAPMTGTATVYG